MYVYKHVYVYKNSISNKFVPFATNEDEII